jgi:hypothetical protein
MRTIPTATSFPGDVTTLAPVVVTAGPEVTLPPITTMPSATKYPAVAVRRELALTVQAMHIVF